MTAITYHRIVPKTEAEALDLLKTELGAAISSCDEIARQPRSGPQFERMTKAMEAVEMCARELFKYRRDVRWLNGIFHFAEVHKRAQRWLSPASVESKKLFGLLADNLRKLQIAYSRIELMRAGTSSPILPAIQEAPEVRAGRPVQVLTPAAAAGRLILPVGYRRG